MLLLAELVLPAPEETPLDCVAVLPAVSAPPQEWLALALTPALTPAPTLPPGMAPVESSPDTPAPALTPPPMVFELEVLVEALWARLLAAFWLSKADSAWATPWLTEAPWLWD